jgi:hypothetical protein
MRCLIEMLKPYSEEHEQQMRAFYTSLPERDKRRYAALEARKLPYGGISYLCRVLGCDPKTIGRGLAELDGLEGASSRDRIRMSAEGITISKPVVKQLLKKHGYVKRKAQTRLSTGAHRDRNAQFEHIAGLKSQYEGTGNPIISGDTKKKSR